MTEYWVNLNMICIYKGLCIMNENIITMYLTTGIKAVLDSFNIEGIFNYVLISHLSPNISASSIMWTGEPGPGVEKEWEAFSQQCSGT